jgi:hypothetical protein
MVTGTMQSFPIRFARVATQRGSSSMAEIRLQQSRMPREILPLRPSTSSFTGLSEATTALERSDCYDALRPNGWDYSQDASRTRGELQGYDEIRGWTP